MNKQIEAFRELARQYREAANHPRNAENAVLYRACNGLRMIRPVVLIDEEPWNELNTDGELDLCCEDPVLREAEWFMRRMLYRWKHYPADLILPDFLSVPKIIGGNDGLLPIHEQTLATDSRNNIRSHHYEDQLSEPEDVQKITLPELVYEKEKTEAKRDRLAEAAGDILPVRIVGRNPGSSPWDVISMYRGVTGLLTDLALRPDHMHAIMRRITDNYVERNRQYKELGLLEGGHKIHCTPALCDELDKPKGEPVQFCHLWGRGMAQIFASVSGDMLEEFEIEYQKEILSPFGLVYYGCCEPLDKKIDKVRKLPNLRKVSVTPWADANIAAEAIGGNYVVSLKPNPAHVGVAFDENVIRSEVGGLLNACRRNGCSCDIVLKDISSVAYRPDHLAAWERIVMELVRSY